MSNRTEDLLNLKCVIKLYDKICSSVCDKYKITKLELDIIAFLNNNPGRDTASDIVELRMLPKANVSQAVDALIKKEFLIRKQDENDRRRIHLELTKKDNSIIKDIEEVQKNFESILFKGFSDEDRSLYRKMNKRISSNAFDELISITHEETNSKRGDK